MPTAYPYLIRGNTNNARNMDCMITDNRRAWPNQPDDAQMYWPVGYDGAGNPINNIFFFTRGMGGAMSPPGGIGERMFAPLVGPKTGPGSRSSSSSPPGSSTARSPTRSTAIATTSARWAGSQRPGSPVAGPARARKWGRVAGTTDPVATGVKEPAARDRLGVRRVDAGVEQDGEREEDQRAANVPVTGVGASGSTVAERGAKWERPQP